jgi:hypothetical protein
MRSVSCILSYSCSTAVLTPSGPALFSEPGLGNKVGVLSPVSLVKPGLARGLGASIGASYSSSRIRGLILLVGNST